MPLELNGVIGVPTGTRARPVVFILHGRHRFDNYDKDRYDTGFTYLVHNLAAKGYLAVAINVNA